MGANTVVDLRTLGQCVIVMDSAAYHSRLVKNQPTTKWRKEQLLVIATEYNRFVVLNDKS